MAMIGFGAFSLGFLLGIVGLIVLEIVAILYVIRRLGRKKESTEVLEKEDCRALSGDPIPLTFDKKGFIWVLDPEKVPKLSTDGASATEGSAKELNVKKTTAEVVPVKKFATIKDDSLIITEQDGSKSTIELVNCKALAVSSSDLSSKKWDKRYPIKLESNGNEVYNGSKTIYIYAETSWEKESWCKALNLFINKEKQKLFTEINKEFQEYICSLNSNYPSFFKPSSSLTESFLDKQNNKNLGPSKMGILLKKLTKKASNKIGIESSRSSSGEINEVRNNFEKLEGLDEKNGDDEGTLCLNLLLSRLFFDAKRSKAISSFINDRIKRSLSNARIPTYIKKITCTSIHLGSVPPFIIKSRVLPMNLDELCALEVEFGYSGGVKLNFETRLEIQEAELQKEILEGQNSNFEAGSEFLEGMEQYRNDLKGVEREVGDNKPEEGKTDELKQQASWASSYITRWKNLVHSISDQVSQVPLSLEMKINSARGTLRLYIKPPPSDQIWFGFQSTPEIDWNIETCIGEHKITNSRVGSLISNRFKAVIKENMVLPNCESISIPFMLGDKNDWVERNIAPFIWIDREPNGSNSKPTIDTSQIKEPNSDAECTNKDEETNKERNTVLITSEDLKQPLLAKDKSQEIGKEGEMVMVQEEDGNKQKRAGTRAKMMDFGKKFGDKLEEKRRLMEEKSRHIVEKMRENAKV